MNTTSTGWPSDRLPGLEGPCSASACFSWARSCVGQSSGSARRRRCRSSSRGSCRTRSSGSVRRRRASIARSNRAPASVASVRQLRHRFVPGRTLWRMRAAARYSNVVSSGAIIPARAPASIDMLQTVIRPSMSSARIADPVYSMTWPVPPPTPMRAMMARMRSLARDAPARAARRRHGPPSFGAALQQALRCQHVRRLPTCRCRTPARRTRHACWCGCHRRRSVMPGLRQSELRADDVDDAALRVGPGLTTVRRSDGRSRRGAAAVPPPPDRERAGARVWSIVVGVEWSMVAIVRSGRRSCRPRCAEFGEGLRGRDLVDEVKVDVEDRWSVRALVAHHVLAPDLLEECSRRRVVGHAETPGGHGGHPVRRCERSQRAAPGLAGAH